MKTRTKLFVVAFLTVLLLVGFAGNAAALPHYRLEINPNDWHFYWPDPTEEVEAHVWLRVEAVATDGTYSFSFSEEGVSRIPERWHSDEAMINSAWSRYDWCEAVIFASVKVYRPTRGHLQLLWQKDYDPLFMNRCASQELEKEVEVNTETVNPWPEESRGNANALFRWFVSWVKRVVHL